jgi:hypothetical protein
MGRTQSAAPNPVVPDEANHISILDKRIFPGDLPIDGHQDLLVP